MNDNSHYSLSVVTEPTAEPVTLDEIRADRNDPPEADNAILLACVKAARERAERYTGRRIMPTVLRLTLDRFPCRDIYLPGGMLQSSTSVSITYTNSTGGTSTMPSSDYRVDTYSEPPRIRPAWETYWPQHRCDLNAVRIQYTAGYADAASVPAGIKSAILLLAGTRYEHREDQVVGETAAKMPRTAEDLLEAYKVGDEFHDYTGE